MKILLIDNYDSFTYNLYQGLIHAGADEVIVIKNNTHTLFEIQAMGDWDGIVISPGPGSVTNPEDIGVSRDILDFYTGKCPILGVCLGHQLIGYHFGAQIDLVVPEHAKVWDVKIVSESRIFTSISEKFPVARYHSQVVSSRDFPEVLKITSVTEDGIIMSLEHKKYSIYGVQFHPESIGTLSGDVLLKNFVDICMV